MIFTMNVAGVKLNKSFLSDVVAFLRTYPIQEGNSLMTAGQVPAAGLARFDFQPRKYQNAYLAATHGVVMHEFSRRGKAQAKHTNAISAYWLPWNADGTTSLVLGTAASYFFTSQIAGCRFVVIPPGGGGANVRVMHVSGRLTRDDRNTSVTNNTTAAERGRASTFTCSVLPPAGYSGFTDANGDPDGEGINVVGIRYWWSGWHFWAQKVSLADTPNGAHRVQRVWQFYP